MFVFIVVYYCCLLFVLLFAALLARLLDPKQNPAADTVASALCSLDKPQFRLLVLDKHLQTTAGGNATAANAVLNVLKERRPSGNSSFLVCLFLPDFN